MSLGGMEVTLQLLEIVVAEVGLSRRHFETR